MNRFVGHFIRIDQWKCFLTKRYWFSQLSELCRYASLFYYKIFIFHFFLFTFRTSTHARMVPAGAGALLIVGSFKKRLPDPDFKVSCLRCVFVKGRDEKIIIRKPLKGKWSGNYKNVSFSFTNDYDYNALHPLSLHYVITVRISYYFHIKYFLLHFAHLISSICTSTKRLLLY